MKIAAVAPGFVIETSDGDQDRQAAKASSTLHLNVVSTQATDSDKPLDEETRQGLRRLTDLILKKNASKSGAAKDEQKDRRRKRALNLYRDLQEARDPLETLGVQLDKVY